MPFTGLAGSDAEPVLIDEVNTARTINYFTAFYPRDVMGWDSATHVSGARISKTTNDKRCRDGCPPAEERKPMNRQHFAAALALLALSGPVPGVRAEDVPLSKVVVPYGAGGGVDAFARPLATVIGDAQKHRVIIDNRAGAGGTLGVQSALQSPADGSTVLAGGVHQPMAEALYPKRNYKIDVDFVPIVITATVPNVLVVPANSQFESLAALVAEAKTHPGKLNYCSSGNGTSQHIVAEMFKRQTDLNIVHVPYRGTAAAMQELIAGYCHMMFDGLGTSAPQIEGKRLRALAVTTAARSRFLPDVMTLSEAGGPAMDNSIWYALWAPKDTPEATIVRLRAQVRSALADPIVKRAWEQQGAIVPSISDESVMQFVKEETAHWTRTVTDLAIRAD